MRLSRHAKTSERPTMPAGGLQVPLIGSKYELGKTANERLK
jgi:hypothetical protein